MDTATFVKPGTGERLEVALPYREPGHKQCLDPDCINCALAAGSHPSELGGVSVTLHTSALMPRVIPSPAEGSQKQRIMALLRQRASGDRTTVRGTQMKRKGMVNLSEADIARTLGMPDHDVRHALEDLMTQGMVNFGRSQTTGTRRSSVLAGSVVRLRVTERGMASGTIDDYAARGVAVVRSTIVEHPELARADVDQPIIGDAIHVREASADEGIIEGVDGRRYAVLRQGEPLPDGFTIPVPAQPDPEKPLSLPLVAKLVGRRHRLTLAAKMIEDDDPDTALALLARADEVAPLEAEVLSLLRLVHVAVGSVRKDPEFPEEEPEHLTPELERLAATLLTFPGSYSLGS